MTERGLPTSDGAPACPFVAFEDDRDERATSPDHRHRCYAEPNPAPRALAHQEAYCLSSAFPVCPTFQDWARREAARSRAASESVAESTAASIAADQAQRNPPRNWQAPPPWMASGGPRPQDDEDFDDRWEREEDDAPPSPPPPPAPEIVDDDVDDDDAEPPARGRGLSGSYADRVAAGGAAAASLRVDPPDDEDDPPAPSTRDAQADWRESAAAAAEQPVRPRRERDPDRMAGFTESHASGPPQPPPTGRGERRRDPRAPEWETGRPLEAFPTIRARRLPELSVPPILVVDHRARAGGSGPVRAAGPARLRQPRRRGRDADAWRVEPVARGQHRADARARSRPSGPTSSRRTTRCRRSRAGSTSRSTS